MKKVVVCANFGNRDYPKDPILEGYNPEWEYVYFTDQQFFSELWTVRQMFPKDIREAARKIKHLTHEYVDYDVMLWIDSSMSLKSDPETMLENLGDAEMLWKVHPNRETSMQEVDACVLVGHFTQEDGKRIKEWYDRNNYGMAIQNSTLIYETGLHVKRNSLETRQFMEELHIMAKDRFFNRDQLALPYLIWQKKPKYALFFQDVFLNMVEYVKHKPMQDLPQISYVTPYATDGNLGRAYNRAVNRHLNNEWVAICDGDMCFLDAKYGEWIAKTIAENKGYDIFVPKTNRLRDSMQVEANMRNVRDILMHRTATEQCWKKRGTNVTEAERPPAGLMMIAKASTFKKVPFRNGLLCLDTDFMIRAKEAGFVIGVMQGVYVFHYYRIGKENDGHLRHMN